MAMTEFTLNHALAVQRWSTSLAVEAAVKAYFSRFIGTSPSSLITLQNELNKGAGEKVIIGLRARLKGPGKQGDAIIEGDATAEEALSFYHDSLYIDQLRKSTKSKGRMTEQRVPYNLRAEGRDALADWWSDEIDQNFFVYLSGARGVNADFHEATSWTGRANNAIVVPDADHIIYAGNATGKADVGTDDVLTLTDIERLVAKADTLDPVFQPFSHNGEKKFVIVMHTFQAFGLRTATSENDWLAIHKATDRGSGALMYKDALGEYADVILHKHRSVIRFSDYGAGTVPAARALFMGAQAGLIAYGQNNSQSRYTWNEEADDRGNALAITAGTIFGVKRTIFNSKSYGVIACDSYLPTP